MFLTIKLETNKVYSSAQPAFTVSTITKGLMFHTQYIYVSSPHTNSQAILNRRDNQNKTPFGDSPYTQNGAASGDQRISEENQITKQQ